MERKVSPKECAELLGISPTWLRELGKRGVLPREGTGKRTYYPWPETRVAYDEHLRQEGRDEGAASDIKAERAALYRVQRQTAELDLAAKRRELVTVDDATTAVGVMLDRIRARLLNLPGRAGPQLVGARTTAEAVGRLDTAVREILTELTMDTDDDDDRSTGSAASSADRKRRKRTRHATPQAS